MSPYVIYVGASTYPLKGLHILIDALRILKLKYPKVKLLIPGSESKDGVLVSPNAYELYILKKIDKYSLQENVVFIGRKNARDIAEILARVNVCVVPTEVR